MSDSLTEKLEMIEAGKVEIAAPFCRFAYGPWAVCLFC